ncbi:MAG: alpha/beta hydrolase [Actinomycetaceae bacterium]|nr:alpha/beta hydrolase [Actinomycetaceae bacterium]
MSPAEPLSQKDVQAIDAAKFYYEGDDSHSGLAVSSGELAQLRSFTAVAEDLGTQEPAVATLFAEKRIKWGCADLQTRNFSAPEGTILAIDVPYAPAWGKGGMLDVFGPDRLRSGLPVVVMIHGGSFMYGYKELNQKAAGMLANMGALVINISYPLAPQATYTEQVRAVWQALQWAQANAVRWGAAGKLTLMGDSAGANLAWVAALAAQNRELRLALQLPLGPSPEVGALALISGVYDLSELQGPREKSSSPCINLIADQFFDDAYWQAPKILRRPELATRQSALPLILLCTSSDDYTRSASLQLHSLLDEGDHVTKLFDFPATSHSLGHVFVTAKPNLEESRIVLATMFDLINR